MASIHVFWGPSSTPWLIAPHCFLPEPLAQLVTAATPPPAPTEAPQPFVPSVAPLDFDLDLSKPPQTAPAPLNTYAAPAIPAPTPVPAPMPAPVAVPVAVPPVAAFDPPRATPPAASYEPAGRSPLLDHDPLDNDFETAPGELDALSRLDSRNARQGEDRTHPATLHAGLPGDSGFIEFDMTALSGLPDANDTRPTALETARTTTLDLPDDIDGSESPHAIKLSLARELHALGDAEGARSLLEEVVSESSGDMQAQARQLLAELH